MTLLSVTGVCIEVGNTNPTQTPWVVKPDSDQAAAPIDIHTSSGYTRSNPRQLTANYTYAIAATGTRFEISLHVIQSFAYINVTDMMIFVWPEKPFTYSMSVDELGNDILTVRFQSQNPLGQFHLTVLQHLTVYSINFTIDPAKVGTYDEASLLYKLYTKSAQYIESDNPEIVAKSKVIVGQETNPYLAAKKIQTFVVRHMKYDMSVLTPWNAETEGALFALRSGKGVCKHYAALFTALARAAGIPTADIWGSFSNPVDSGHSKHSWVHFYIPNYGWIPADPTFEDSTGDNWFARLPQSWDIPVMSVNYLYEQAWWSGGRAQGAIPGQEPATLLGLQVAEFPGATMIALVVLLPILLLIKTRRNRR
jgi:hypothetical protein